MTMDLPDYLTRFKKGVVFALYIIIIGVDLIVVSAIGFLFV